MQGRDLVVVNGTYTRLGLTVTDPFLPRRRLTVCWSTSRKEYIAKHQTLTERKDGRRIWMTQEGYACSTCDGVAQLMRGLGFMFGDMPQPLYVFSDGRYRFWMVVFSTPLAPVLMRVPEGTAPLTTWEGLLRQREEAYQRDASVNRWQDPVREIRPADEELIDKWLENFGEDWGYLGMRWVGDGAGGLVEQEHRVPLQRLLL